MSQNDISKIKKTLKKAFSSKTINKLGQQTGLSQRLRVVTPFKLLLALVSGLASGNIETIADLLREFNYQNQTTTAYKAFYNRLAQKGFAEFMRNVVSLLLKTLSTRILQPSAQSPLSKFSDIIIHDGTSFGLNDSLKNIFAARFTAIRPAAVELHTTYSGCEDQVTSIVLTADKESEKHYLPKPSELTNKLFLADRAYCSTTYFYKMNKAKASFIIRLTRNWKPYVMAMYTNNNRKIFFKRPIRLPEFLAQHPKGVKDLDVILQKGKKSEVFRLIALPGKESGKTRLCTNLSRESFSAELIGQLYRFRWQVELCFKEWKSYANLHRFNTGNAYLAEGLIWACLASAIFKRFLAHAAQFVSHDFYISTRKVAMCAKLFIPYLFIALNNKPHLVNHVLHDAISFLQNNARRSHAKRDKQLGRLNIGLELATCVPK